MHIITGLLVTAFLGKKVKQQQAQSPLLLIKWPIETRHLLPGRVRFHVPLLVGDRDGVQRVETQMKRIDGVYAVEANIISGSVLIQYQEDKLTPELLLAVYAITRSPVRALNMLIIDYSCGVRLSTATALSASICTAARHGILIKGSNYIEMLSKSDTLILDKTGTLTEGKAQVVSIVPINARTERDVVKLAAAAKESSTHPMATAVMEKIRFSGWKIPEHSETQVYVARG